jgi:hypothetical protein
LVFAGEFIDGSVALVELGDEFLEFGEDDSLSGRETE